MNPLTMGFELWANFWTQAFVQTGRSLARSGARGDVGRIRRDGAATLVSGQLMGMGEMMKAASDPTNPNFWAAWMGHDIYVRHK